MFFIKMNGLGNDYIFIAQEEIKKIAPSRLAKKMCDRHFSVGGDGIVIFGDSLVADCKMRIWNNDGSEGEMCGNALRCLGRYLSDLHPEKSFFSVETKAGIKTVCTENTLTEINLGKPKYIDREPFSVSYLGEKIEGIRVDMGNPHFVLAKPYCKNMAKALSENELFPHRTNVEFVKKLSDGVFVRVYERGSGETMACGTGAGAVFATTGVTSLTVRMPGGELFCRTNEKGEILQKGIAQYNYKGNAEEIWYI